MADDDRAAQPDPAAAAARSMTQLAQQMREMADRMLGGGLPGWPVPGVPRTPSPSPSPSPDRLAAAPDASPPAAGPPAAPGVPTIPGFPSTPVAMSARQVQAVVDDITARRSQITALVAQLQAFDEQLGTLETSLRPLLQWLRTWSDLEGAVTDFWTPKPPRG